MIRVAGSFERLLALLLVAAAGILSGCAAKQMPGFENAYQGHTVPDELIRTIESKFAQYGLKTAAVTRDLTGRLRLTGSYRDEDEVDTAFTIVQTVVGLKATSPFYPQNIRVRRWEASAAQSLQQIVKPGAGKPLAQTAGIRKALVIGINTFKYPNIPPIQGEDDARSVASTLSSFGYQVTSLFGTDATKSAIEAAIQQTESELRPEDSLFIYVSSHGTLPLPTAQGGDNRKMSIVAYDSGSSQGDGIDKSLQLQKTSVRDTLLQSLASRPSRATRVLIDTCYSGEILRDLPAESRQFIARQNQGAPDRSGISVGAWVSKSTQAKGIKTVNDLPPASLANADTSATAGSGMPKRTGFTLITASGEGQLAYGPSLQVGTFQAPVGDQPKTLRGSFFTQTFVAYLELLQGQIAPAFERASRFTSDHVVNSSRGRERQDPRMLSTFASSDDDLNKH